MPRAGLIAALFFTAGLAHAGGSTLDCPTDYTDDSLETFRDNAVSIFTGGNFGLLKDKLSSCFPNNKLPTCLNELQYENSIKVAGLGNRNLDDLIGEEGSESPESYLTIKSSQDLPKEFRTGDGGVRIPPDILNLAKQKGWKAVAYKTRSTGGFDNPANLTLVAIPGKDKDIYLQISPVRNADPEHTWTDPIPHPSRGDISTGQGTLTIITVDKTQDPPLGQLRRMFGDGSSYKWTNDLRSQSCTNCHSAPLRSISPRGYLVTNGAEQRMPKEMEDMVTEINSMMLIDKVSWGDVTIRGVKLHRGPQMNSQPIGWAPENSATRKEAFIKSCAQSADGLNYHSIGPSDEDNTPDIYHYEQSPQHMSDVRPRKIAAAMNCIQCHNNTIRGYLSKMFNDKEIRFKVLVDRSMPPGADLTPDERLALVNCLLEERRSLSQKWWDSGSWFKREACETMDVPAPAGERPLSTTPASDRTTQ